MNENQKQVLQMLADGKINVEEAQRLLDLVKSESARNETGSGGEKGASDPRFIHVVVEPKEGVSHEGFRHKHHGKVNVRVPLGLIRAGIKLATLIPSEAAEHVDKAFKEKGFSFDVRRIKEEDLEIMIEALKESAINVDTEYESVRINAE